VCDVVMCAADLSAVDNLQSTAWDYACVRKLHYSMLIIASYFRQRNCNNSAASDSVAVENGVDSAVPHATLGEGLGINSLQV